MNITPLLSHPSARVRLAAALEQRRHERMRAVRERHEKHWWSEDEDGNGGCAFVGCLAVALLIYAVLAVRWFF